MSIILEITTLPNKQNKYMICLKIKLQILQWKFILQRHRSKAIANGLFTLFTQTLGISILNHTT